MKLSKFYKLKADERAQISDLIFDEHCDITEFSQEQFQRFGEILATCSSLTSLAFYEYNLSNLNLEQWMAFCDAIAQCRSLKRLSLVGCALYGLSDQHWIKFGEMLSQNLVLNFLDFSQNDLGLIEAEEELNGFQYFLKQCHSLQRLNLSKNQLEHFFSKQGRAVETVFSEFTSLTELYIGFNNFGSLSTQDWKWVCRALAQCRLLTKLDLYRIGFHQFSTSHWKIFNQLLITYQHLNTLCFGFDNFSRNRKYEPLQWLLTLARILKQFDTIETLEFTSDYRSLNSLTTGPGIYHSDDFLYLGQVGSNCKGLKNFKFEAYIVNKWIPFSQMLHNLKQLTQLALGISINDLTVEQLHELGQILSQYSRLEILSFEHSSLYDMAQEQWTGVENILKRSSKLKTFNITHTSLWETLHYEHNSEKRDRFLAFLEALSSDLDIVYSDNSFSSEAESQIQTALMRRSTHKINTTTSHLVAIIHRSSITIDYTQQLGFGGYGAVYKGTWGATDVAIKKLHATQLTTKSIDSFQAEAQNHYSFKHPNIVTLYGIVLGPEQYFMVMAQMSCSLRDILLNDTPLSRMQIYAIAHGIIEGIGYLHDHGVIHRDLKSGNVLIDITKGFQPCITDFGLSEVKTEISNKNLRKEKQEVVGSLRWMAPEIFMNLPCSVLTDIYAFGVILWEFFSKPKLPFQEISNQIVKAKVRNGEREIIPANTPISAANLIQGCWQQDPTKRPQQARLIAGALRLFKMQEKSRCDLQLKPSTELSSVERELIADDPGFQFG